VSEASHTTAVLLRRVRSGDPRARAALVARVEPLLRRFAHGRVPQLLRHEQDTADLVQWTWLKVLERLEHIQTQAPGDFFAYLRTALVNGIREALRREHRHPRADLPDVSQAEAVLPAQSVDAVDWLSYEQALVSLSGQHRALVIMRFEFGMSFVEIGEEVGETANAVRLKINRALARMVGMSADEAES
jgi:RNA polymerase sigma-70 factor (ECF subfamily)